MRYIVTQRYASSYGGPWSEGERVDIETWLADIINIDSPGTLRPDVPPSQSGHAVDVPPSDRMARGPGRKRAGV